MVIARIRFWRLFQVGASPLDSRDVLFKKDFMYYNTPKLSCAVLTIYYEY